MKSALLLLVMVILLPSCGKDSNRCKNKESARLECRAVNQPTYGYHYAQEMCDRSYQMDRCY